MARLYSNENFPQPAVDELRLLGHDVLTVLETGKAEQAWPDEAVLAFASEQQRVLLTMNRKHFIRLHEKNPQHAGIIVCTVDRDFIALARRIDETIRQTGTTSGKLLRVNRPNPSP